MAEIAVVDPLAAVRRGIEHAVRARGHSFAQCSEPLDWSAGAETASRLLVIAVVSPTDLSLVNSVARSCAVVALVEDSVTAFRSALAAGALGAVERGAEPERIAAVVDAALDGDCLLRGWVAVELSRTSASMIDHVDMREDEAQWITSLAGGMTVAALAADVGYSEREMFRLLHSLYVRMGAKNRTEALMLATKWGVVDPD